MDFRKLRNFVQIVELSSITAAADYLNIAQSALSRQVKALEDELNVPLLRRNGRGVVPTEAGIHLAQRAKVILVDIEALVAEISGNPKCLSGIVTLGLSPTVAEILGPHLVERTLETFPEIKLRMVSGLSHQIQDWLLRGTIDLGITYAGHKSPSINARLIMKEQLFLVQPPNADLPGNNVEIEAKAALQELLILPNSEHLLRVCLDNIAREKRIELNVALQIDILPARLALVERGFGSTILPLVSVINQVRAGRLIARPIVRPSIELTVALMAPLVHPGARPINDFANFLGTEIHHLVTSDRWPGRVL